MNTTYGTETLHRLVKQAIDSGAADTIEEAERLFHGYRLAIGIDAERAGTYAGQVALLTLVALGRRVFLGGVEVAGAIDHKLVVHLPFASTQLSDAVVELGGSVVARHATNSAPLVTVGESEGRWADHDFHVRAAYAGWRGGILPRNFDCRLDHAPPMPLGPMLAAALAVNEAFLHIRGETPEAGRRAVGLSLWQPAAEHSWLEAHSTEVELHLLPSRLWLLGLGHLGQAFLWALGLLPYAANDTLQLVLQDDDFITPSTESTSILTDASMVRKKKTRAMAQWAEQRGFQTSLVERRFTDKFVRDEGEPTVALCGLDNALGRRALERSGFSLVVEAGLGRGYRDFRTLRLHTLPGSRTAAEIWRNNSVPHAPIDRPAYATLLEKGVLDRCGVTILAGKAVGAPFVGAVAATLVISEVLRHLHGGSLMQLIDLDLLSLEHRVVVPQRRDFSGFNPGYVKI